MCLIPENSIFCYGNWKNLAKTAFIIDSNNIVSHAINAPVTIGLCGLIYYKNYVYFFGGHNGSVPVNTAFNYDLKTFKWASLYWLPTPACFISSIVRKNKILLSGYDHSSIYCYDITQNCYNGLHNVQPNYFKIVCGNKKNYYVIETGGNIYESNHEWKVWNAVGSSGIENAHNIGFSVLWKNKAYFTLLNYNLYEFDMKEKKILKKKTI